MKPAKKILLLRIALIALLVLIWGNSLLPATISSGISDAVGQGLHKLLPFLPSGTQEASLGFSPLRKLGHFTEFALLGLVLTNLTVQTHPSAPIWSRTLLCGLLIALTDETLQYLSAGRGPMVTDVWIDFSGVLMGFGLVRLLQRRNLWQQRKRPD